MDVHTSTLLSDASADLVGVAPGASGADVLVSVQGDGVVQYDAAKEVCGAHLLAGLLWRQLVHSSAHRACN